MRKINADYISEFNDALLQIRRLHNMWIKCEWLRENGDLEGWRWKLDGIEIELKHDIERLSTKEKNYLKELDEINKKIKNCKTKAELYKLLKEKSEFLRKIQNEAGKGDRWKLAEERM